LTKTSQYRIKNQTRTKEAFKMPAAQSPEFKKAVEESRKLKAKPTDNELLEVCTHVDVKAK
jgi:hypothetical protein